MVQILALLILTAFPSAGSQDLPRVAQDLDHSSWDSLLKQYVSAEFRVDYRKWKNGGTRELDTYLSRVAGRWPPAMTPAARKTALINAYNALTIRWVLENYPLKSIWQTSHPFTGQRHVLDGNKVSLDEIESGLRKMGDPRVHSALVCASRSCPPLRGEAYKADRLENQLDDNTRAWLAHSDLNAFDSVHGIARVSMIFKWYSQDFEQNGNTVRTFLARHAPAGQAAFLGGSNAKIEYKTYAWGLNDTSALGSDYSEIRFLWDYFRNRF